LLAGKYRIERFVAEGGMGVVVEATHLQLEERVAIKFLRPEALGGDDKASSDATTRFVREARAAIKIRSEHVVRIYDVASLESGAPYIVMEFLEGADLEHVLSEKGALTPSDAIDHILQACEALGEAHALGIVHRDLKPANLFLTKTAAGMPIIKVLDFGISKLGGPGQSMSMTSTQAVMGSPLYMSPEQMRATKDADARSDIWAIGVILYELLGGRPPFNGETMTQVCAAILQDTPPTLASMRRDMPHGLEAVINRCLEKRAIDRFSSVAELAEALAPFASPVGQEAARRTARSASFSMGTRPSMQSERELQAAGNSLAAAAPRVPSGPGATSTAWGDESQKTRKKSRGPMIAAGVVALVAVVGLGGFMMRGRGGSTSTATNLSPERASAAAVAAPSTPATETAAPPAAPTPTAPVATAAATGTTAPAPTETASAATAPTKTDAPKPEHVATSTKKRPAAATAAPKPVAAAPAAPAAPSATPKASWNDRK
jgi:serine/threonine-protein kinase